MQQAEDSGTTTQAREAPGFIDPHAGRRVWFFPNDYQGGYPGSTVPVSLSGAPMDAGVAFVHNPREINIAFADHHGNMHTLRRVRLMQDGDYPVTPGTPFCAWMPYQVEQARREAMRKSEPVSATAADGFGGFVGIYAAGDAGVAATSGQNGASSQLSAGSAGTTRSAP